ncbi:MAG: Golgi to ER traffic protein 4 [Paramarteilia canceri]
MTRADGHLAKGDAYQAHQAYKAVFNRFKSRISHKESADLLLSCAEKLIESNNTDSGLDLVITACEFLKNSARSNRELYVQVIKSCANLPLSTSPSERNKLFSQLLAWAEMNSIDWEDEFHLMINKFYVDVKKYENAVYHALKSRSLKITLETLDIVLESCYESEIDQIIVKTVVKSLVLNQLALSKNILNEFKKEDKFNSNNLSKSHKNFLEWLIESVEKYLTV